MHSVSLLGDNICNKTYRKRDVLCYIKAPVTEEEILLVRPKLNWFFLWSSQCWEYLEYICICVDF